jgi:hypothetical protein
MQDNAGQCRTMHDNTGQCSDNKGQRGQCRTMLNNVENAGKCRTAQGIENVQYTAEQYAASM